MLCAHQGSTRPGGVCCQPFLPVSCRVWHSTLDMRVGVLRANAFAKRAGPDSARRQLAVAGLASLRFDIAATTACLPPESPCSGAVFGRVGLEQRPSAFDREPRTNGWMLQGVPGYWFRSAGRCLTFSLSLLVTQCSVASLLGVWFLQSSLTRMLLLPLCNIVCVCVWTEGSYVKACLHL